MPILENERYELFAQSLARGETATKAYSDAGYKPSRKNAWRLKTNKDVIERVAELQCNAARSTEVSIQSLIHELDDAIDVARAKGQAQAMVSAAGMKAKLSGLMVERSQVQVVNAAPEPTSPDEVLHEIAMTVGEEAALALGKAFGLEFDPDWRPGDAPQLKFGRAVCQRQIEERKPAVARKREIG